MYCTRFPVHVFAQNLLKCTMEHQSTYKVNISSTLVLFGMYRYLAENRDSLSLMKFYFINYPRYVNHMYMLHVRMMRSGVIVFASSLNAL